MDNLLLDIVRAKPGDRVGKLKLLRKGVENDFFGWWVCDAIIDTALGAEGFVSLQNLLALARKDREVRDATQA